MYETKVLVIGFMQIKLMIFENLIIDIDFSKLNFAPLSFNVDNNKNKISELKSNTVLVWFLI